MYAYKQQTVSSIMEDDLVRVLCVGVFLIWLRYIFAKHFELGSLKMVPHRRNL
jgi:hypothetical protein